MKSSEGLKIINGLFDYDEEEVNLEEKVYMKVKVIFFPNI
jgi:hypothetical protein